MSYVQNIISAVITVLALVLLIISFTAYRRTKNMRVGFICLAFGVFFLKGLLMSLGLLVESFHELYTSGGAEFLDLGVVILLALGIFRK